MKAVIGIDIAKLIIGNSNRNFLFSRFIPRPDSRELGLSLAAAREKIYSGNRFRDL